jgi:hypothetical protein
MAVAVISTRTRLQPRMLGRRRGTGAGMPTACMEFTRGGVRWTEDA